MIFYTIERNTQHHSIHGNDASSPSSRIVMPVKAGYISHFHLQFKDRIGQGFATRLNRCS